MRRKVEPLRGWVDAVNITDSQGAHARLSNWAGSLLALAAGVEPVMQVTCRDRNRIALQSDLLSAAALGIPNVVLMTGDHPRFGDHPDAKPVFDLDSVQLVWTARTMRDEGRLLSGRTLDPPPRWLIGAVENPFAPPAGFRAARLGKKVAAGAEFAQTQFVFDVPAFARWMAEVRDLGLDARCKILAGVGPVRSLRALEYMQRQRARACGSRTRSAAGCAASRPTGWPMRGSRSARRSSSRSCEIPGVSGVHVMAPGFEHGIPEILARAGLARPSARGPGAAMHIDVRPVAKLRGPGAVDVAAALGPVFSALSASPVDLARLRVVCDWIQYRHNFAEPVACRPVLAEPAPAGARASPAPAAALRRRVKTAWRSPSTCAAAARPTWRRGSRRRWPARKTPPIPGRCCSSPGCPPAKAASGGSTRSTGRRCHGGSRPPAGSTSRPCRAGKATPATPRPRRR